MLGAGVTIMGLILLLITILLSYLLCCRDTGQPDTATTTQPLHGTQVNLVVTLVSCLTNKTIPSM